MLFLNTIKPIHPNHMKKTTNLINPNKEMLNNTFLEKFEKIKSDKVREHSQALFDKINEQSEKFGDKLYLKDLVEYKKLVREFLDVAINNSHAFSRDSFLDRRGRHRVLSQVKQVDRELASLTNAFLKEEADRIKVLKKIDDIRGLLMDIFI
ncbi:YaaR family protein [Marinisporobacter balticus]|nr:YaaR family protein [Marinisporobacter balticus]